VVSEVVDQHTGDGASDDWDLDALWTELKTLYPISITVDEVLSEIPKGRLTPKVLKDEVLSDAKIAYQRREEQLSEPAMRELERRVVLSVIDRRWRDHLYEMDYLKDGIGLRAMAQRDPLVEYQREGFALYQNMMGAIREESVGFLYNLEVEVSGVDGEARVAARGLGGSDAPASGLSYSAPSADAQGEVEVRDQRGQLERAATALAQQAQQRQADALTQGQGQPAQGGQPPAAAPARGAFGQRTDGSGGAPAPANRAERRAAEKKGN
jgi:preprotein translocase subunit SecA